MRCVWVSSRFWAAPNFVLANIEEKQFGIAKEQPRLSKILHLAGDLFEDTPNENLNISSGLSEVCDSQLMDIWYIWLLFRAFFLRQGNWVKTLHVSGADGWYQFIYQYLWGRMSKILGAQKFFAEWYNQMSDPILVKPILGLRPPPFLQVIWEKLYLRAFYVLKTTFSKILSFRWFHIP